MTMRRYRPDYVVFYRRGPNLRLWLILGTGLLGFIACLAMGWNVLLSLAVGAGISVVVRAAMNR
jgi:hypothetical protein